MADLKENCRYQLDDYREAFRTLMERSAVGKVFIG